MTGRRIGLALAALGAVVGLTACGVERTIDPVASAATKSEQAGGSKMAMTMTVSAAGRSFTITADGAFDQGQGEMTMDMSDILAGAGLPVDAGGKIKLLYLKEDGDPVTYMQFPFLAGRLPGGKTWIRLDLQQAGKGLGFDMNQMMGQSTQNPAQALDMLRASGDVEKVGSDTVDGTATTEYKGTVDLAKAAKLRGISETMVQKLIDSGAPATVPVEVWIGDDDGLVRKLHLTEDMTVQGQSASLDLEIDISDYGTPVTVTAPPADQVMDATGLAAGAANSAASSMPAPTA